MYVSLPMYDWPEVRADLDELWLRISVALNEQGVDTPPGLDRQTDLELGWLRPDLLLSQTCGLPYVRRLIGRVTLVAGVDQGLPDLLPGQYCSRIVAHKAAEKPLCAFRGARVAINSLESQSGAGSLCHVLLPMAESGRFFTELHLTGSHAGSIRAVAEGRADIAAIDAMTWELARRHLPQARELAVIASTPATAGLPMITGLGVPAAVLYQAIAKGLSALHQDQRDALGMQGLVPRSPRDLDLIAQWDAEPKDLDELLGLSV